MPDKISLVVGGYKVENFISYTIDSDLYVADDAFSIELANPEVKVFPGLQCELRVNDKCELTGIIDKVSKSYDKSGVKLRVEGRDLMGLLTDSYCEEFITVQNMTLKTLAERLLKNVPFLPIKTIEYQDNVVGKLKSKKTSHISLFDTPQNFGQIEPGMTIAEVLKEYSHSRGMMFWCKSDGALVFGKPVVSCKTGFRLINKKGDGSEENNIIEGEKTEDISKQYSKITVIGQPQGTDSLIPSAATGPKETAENDAVQFYKPLVAKNNNDSLSLKMHTRMLKEKMRHEGFQLQYKVAGHSQYANWTINEMTYVYDEVLDVNGDYLIYGRTFEMSKDKGVTTTVRLGYPGVIK